MRGAVPDGQQVVVPRNVTVPGQVIGVLKVAGTPAAGVLDNADSGLWGSKENGAVVTSSSPKTLILGGPFQLRTSTTVAQLPKPAHQRSGLPPVSSSLCHAERRSVCQARGNQPLHQPPRATHCLPTS